MKCPADHVIYRMISSTRPSVSNWFRGSWFGPGLVLLLAPTFARAQSAAASTPERLNIISVSPAELFYKTQVGYERQLNSFSSLGLLGAYRYGFSGRYEGWQATAQYRLFFGRGFPGGAYFQVQASVFNHLLEANLTNPKTYKTLSFDYRAVGGGGGFGFGYRRHLLRQALGGHLLGNVLLGFRFQQRPQPSYDTTVYQPSVGFLGQVDEANWRLGHSPGSIVHGLLSLDYSF